MADEQGAIPEGWKLVPIKPTEAMIEAAINYRPVSIEDRLKIAWADMVGAAPACTPAADRLADTGEPWPGYTADQDRRRVVTLATLGLMLSVMAGGDAPEVIGFDATDLYAEVLMALAIEDAENPDIALEIARDHPEAHLIATPKPPGDAGDMRERCEQACFNIAQNSLLVLEGRDAKIRHEGIVAGANACAAAIRNLPDAGEGM